MSDAENEWSDDGATATTVLHASLETFGTNFVLLAVRGPQQGTRFLIDGSSGGPDYIGQSATCTIQLTDPTVSRRHASVDLTGTILRLRDHASTNGTFVNGLRITDVFLRGGEEIQIGSTVLRVEAHADQRKPVLSDATGFGHVIGRSLAMRRLYPVCERLALSEVPLVLEGETGTGKEALAEAIHQMGPRATGPFVVFDCTAVHSSLIEAALFGHERGAFTGAVGATAGVFEEAHKGTLLIDEIGDLDKPLQAKLLRAIQNAEVKRIGGTKWIKVDVRIIAATRRDLDAEVQAGRFRDDLFFRLAVTRLTLPPLRDRRDDIEVLAKHFWSAFSKGGGSIPADVLERFGTYDWPGNVRELANTVARLVALGELVDGQTGGLFMKESRDLDDGGSHREGADFIDAVVAKNLELSEARDKILREFEKRYVERLLEIHQGDVSKAAAASGIGERYLRVIRARVRDHSA